MLMNQENISLSRGRSIIIYIVLLPKKKTDFVFRQVLFIVFTLVKTINNTCLFMHFHVYKFINTLYIGCQILI